MIKNRPFHSIFVVFFFLVLIAPISGTAKEITTSAKVVAIGDIHGAYDAFKSALTELKLIDKQANWIGGDTHLVSLGDLVDRGKDSRKVVDLVIKLEQQASAAGGALHLVLGNHDIMAMTGDFRYVSLPEFLAFSDMENAGDREWLHEQYESIKAELSKEAQSKSFDQLFPKGFMGLVSAYDINGKYGKWLREHGHSIIKVNDTLFVHAGLSAEMFSWSIKAINESNAEDISEYVKLANELKLQDQLTYITEDYDAIRALNNALKNPKQYKDEKQDFNKWKKDASRLIELQSSQIFSSTGPYWYRGTAYCPVLSESYTLEHVLKRFKAKRVVIGHSTKYKRLASRMGGIAILADTGMLKSYYDGIASAVIFNGNNITTFHADSSKDKGIIEEPQKFNANPNGMSDKAVEEFLLTADITEDKAIGTGITKSRVLTLKKDGLELRASFKVLDNSKGLEKKETFGKTDENSDRYVYEVAAYKLDRMLDQNLIPPAVIREINGKRGAVQLWLENMTTENKRSDSRMEFTGLCSISDQYRMRIVFDTLIYNTDRNNGNLLWDKDFILYFIDHSQAFGTSIRKPDMYRKNPLQVSNLYRTKLASLNLEQLKTELGDYLHPRQIEAILKRRDYILENASIP